MSVQNWIWKKWKIKSTNNDTKPYFSTPTQVYHIGLEMNGFDPIYLNRDNSMVSPFMNNDTSTPCSSSLNHKEHTQRAKNPYSLFARLEFTKWIACRRSRMHESVALHKLHGRRLRSMCPYTMFNNVRYVYYFIRGVCWKAFVQKTVKWIPFAYASQVNIETNE